MNKLEVSSPFDGEFIGEVPLTDADGIEHALQSRPRTIAFISPDTTIERTG